MENIEIIVRPWGGRRVTLSPKAREINRGCEEIARKRVSKVIEILRRGNEGSLVAGFGSHMDGFAEVGKLLQGTVAERRFNKNLAKINQKSLTLVNYC